MDNDKLNMNELLSVAALFLQLEEVEAALKSDTVSSAAEDVKQTVDMLVKCANLVLKEIAAEYFPLKICEEVTVRNGELFLSQLKEKATAVYKVYYKQKSVPFRLFYDRLSGLKDGLVTVEYAYEPSDAVLSGETAFPKSRPGARVAAYGVACEYCLISGMTDEAVLWDKRYKDALASVMRQKNERRLAERAWG